METVTRRQFLTSAAAGVAVAPFMISGTKAAGNVIGANERINVAVAGIHGQGQSHIKALDAMPGVEVTYLIDPDSSLFSSRTELVKNNQSGPPRCVQDVRQALDDNELDAISIATCNHWHSLITIWACQAGKDVYVEKPLSHNVVEGRRAVEAARKYQRIVQHGTQQRSSLARAKEIAAVQSGHYGKLRVSKGYCCKPRWGIGVKPVAAPPDHLDFNLWLGPARATPYHANRVHYNWHWFWDTGNGDIGNQGVHEMDVARWAIPGATLPRQVWSLGGRFGYNDQAETPNTQMTVFDYGESLLIFEVRGLVGNSSKDSRKVANEYYLDDGMITQGRFYPQGGGKAEPLIDAGGSVNGGNKFDNWISAVRSRDYHELNADVLEGHYSSALCHLANTSYRLGERVPFDKKTYSFGDNPEVYATFNALERNLSYGVGLRMENLAYQLGRTLKFDADREIYLGDRDANNLLTRPPREPFVVPEKV